MMYLLCSVCHPPLTLHVRVDMSFLIVDDFSTVNLHRNHRLSLLYLKCTKVFFYFISVKHLVSLDSFRKTDPTSDTIINTVDLIRLEKYRMC